ncbi:hypothetical protein SAMN05216226_110139 [Halovenus aranensis]|jgi:hypothetical protein|uniref:Uncharacterized protein n=1 Tax=Halovenus aranensis TaxID=890420 RepID=A0A1G8X7B3_9EURY|nr:hypothetical protein [Halovenus aranensis]SDJ86294.1 hypothetical protein SAMN05216226_110139 [Halovenus aranensis]
MNQILRFWVLIGSGTVAVLSFGYLFLSLLTFLGPEVSLVTTETDGRLAATGVALASLGAFVWTFSFTGTPAETNPGERA